MTYVLLVMIFFWVFIYSSSSFVSIFAQLHQSVSHSKRSYYKTCYFCICCILISQFWNVEILLRVNFAFSQCSTGIYWVYDGQTEFSRVLNLTILCYSQKFCARKNNMVYSIVPYIAVNQGHSEKEKARIVSKIAKWSEFVTLQWLLLQHLMFKFWAKVKYCPKFSGV